MKTKITKREILNNYANVICVGFCGVDCLLNYETPKYYTSGLYGWNADIYVVNMDTVIVTGYRPFGNIRVDYDLQVKYESAAERIVFDNGMEYDRKEREMKKLLNEFIVFACIPKEILEYIKKMDETDDLFVGKTRCLIVADKCKAYGIDAFPILSHISQMGLLGNLDWAKVMDEVGYNN